MIKKEVRIINDKEVHLFFDTDQQAYLVASDAMELFLQSMQDLKQYENNEKQGLILRLPCKIGDDIFVIPSEVNYRLNKSFGAKGLNSVRRQVVHHIEFNSYGYLIATNEGATVYRQEAFCETWFLTKEEAEAALQALQEDKR